MISAALALLSRVPKDVWLGIAAGLVIIGATTAVYVHGYHNGAAVVQAKWDTDRAHLESALAAEKVRQAQVVTRTVVEYRDRVQIVKEKGDEIIKQIPILIPAGIQLSGAFRVLHDAAASGELPQDPRGAAAAADPVEVTAALETVGANYTACRADQARLAALQQIVVTLNPEGASQ